MMRLLLSLAAAAPVICLAASPVKFSGENMNGEYVISKTPGASGAKFNTKWSECETPHLRSVAAPPRHVL